MKKMLLSFAVLSAFGASAQLVNGNFEDAMTNFASQGYPEVSQTNGWGQGVYVAETSSPGEGAQSAKLVSTYDASLNALYGFPSDTITGFLVQEVNGTVTNPSSIMMDFKYQYSPVGTDTAMIAIEIYDTLLAGFNDDVLLYAGYLFEGANVSTWTNGSITVQATPNSGTPNQIYIYALSSAGGFYPSDFAAPNPNSTLWLDAVSVSNGTAGLNENAISADVYPNPTSDVLNVKSSEGIASVTITSMDGKVVATSTGSSVNVSELNAGMYLYTATTVSGKIANGNFVKK